MENNGNPSEQPSPAPSRSFHDQQYREDEIDLVDIWRVLMRKWRWIAAITLISTIFSISYVLLAPRVYKAEAYILPPKQSDIEQLNVSVLSSREDKRSGIIELSSMTPDDVYNETLKDLQSLSVRRLFFDNYKLIDLLTSKKTGNFTDQKVFVKAFHQKLTVSRGKKDKSDFVTIALEGTNPQHIASWLNSFLHMVDGYTAERLVQNLYATVNAKKESAKNQINALRQVAKKRRLDRIAELEEALFVATQLGIKQRTNASSLPPTQREGNLELGVAVNTVETPLYLRGIRELQAEIEVLQKRKSDDPFIVPLRSLQEELSQLNQIQASTNQVKSFRLDQKAVAPETPIKPKRKLLVVLGAVLGLMLGFFAAFVINFIENARSKAGLGE